MQTLSTVYFETPMEPSLPTTIIYAEPLKLVRSPSPLQQEFCRLRTNSSFSITQQAFLHSHEETEWPYKSAWFWRNCQSRNLSTSSHDCACPSFFDLHQENPHHSINCGAAMAIKIENLAVGNLHKSAFSRGFQRGNWLVSMKNRHIHWTLTTHSHCIWMRLEAMPLSRSSSEALCAQPLRRDSSVFEDDLQFFVLIWAAWRSWRAQSGGSDLSSCGLCVVQSCASPPCSGFYSDESFSLIWEHVRKMKQKFCHFIETTQIDVEQKKEPNNQRKNG